MDLNPEELENETLLNEFERLLHLGDFMSLTFDCETKIGRVREELLKRLNEFRN